MAEGMNCGYFIPKAEFEKMLVFWHRPSIMQKLAEHFPFSVKKGWEYDGACTCLQGGIDIRPIIFLSCERCADRKEIPNAKLKY